MNARKHQVGFFPSLATQLGAGSFEAGGTKYATYLAGGTRLAQEMRTAWAALQQEARVGATCPLGHLLSEAVVLLDGPEVGGLSEDGTSPKQLQRLLTHEVEQEHYRALGKEIMLLPGVNWERMAWRACESATARAWVTSWPKPTTTMSRDVLEIRVATYFGKPIPLLHSLVGNPIKWVKKDGSRHTEPHPCDPYGSRLWCAQGGTDDRFRVAHDCVQHVIAALARRINGVQVEETPYGVFYRELTQAQLQQVTDRVPCRDRQGMVPDVAFHGLGGTSAQYYELKGLRASKNTYPRGPNTGVAKRAASVQVEHVRKLRKLDQKLYGIDIDSASPPGPLLTRFRALGEVHPIVFGAYGEVSEGMEVLIGKLADAWAPRTDR